jgi:hypothetical protein
VQKQLFEGAHARNHLGTGLSSTSRISAASSLVTGGARAVGSLGQGAAAIAHSEMAGTRGPTGADAAADPGGAYNLDKLFRGNYSGHSPDVRGDGARATDARGEILHIATNAAMSGTASDEDRVYLAELVVAKTGVSTDEAQKRIDAFIHSVKEASAEAKAAADEARKSAATAALYTAMALLIGAFIASVSAALGGRLRDEHL